MKKLRCIVVDDNELDRLTICSYLSHFPEIIIEAVFDHPHKALTAIQKTLPDIIFLDVNMPMMTGLELRKHLLSIPICIFTTNHPDYAVDSFELETLDYLLKPYTFDRFTKTIEKIFEYNDLRQRALNFDNAEQDNFLFIKEGIKQSKINIDEVLYLSAMQNYTVINTKINKHYILSSLAAILQDTHFSHFVRIHRSYAVNPLHIQQIYAHTMILSNAEKLPIGRSYKKALSL